MTRLYVDQREVDLPRAGFETLDQVVRHVEDNVLQPRSVIRQIEIDGLPLAVGDLGMEGALLPSCLADRERIDVYTGNVCDIARESITEAQSYLERVEAAIPSIALSFQLSPGPDTFEQLKQLYDGFYWLNLLLDRLGTLLGVGAEIGNTPDKPVRDCHLRFATILKQLVDAQESQDFVLIADLLEYEILPLIPEWKGLFATLSELAGKEH